MDLTAPIRVSVGSEPVSLGLMKEHCRIDSGDEDVVLNHYITAAREWFETALNRTIANTTWKAFLPWFPDVFVLPYPPLLTVSHLKYLDTNNVQQTLSSATYVVATGRTPGEVMLADGELWPESYTHPQAIEIQWTAGQTTVPSRITQGILLLAGHWYENRESVLVGVTGSEVPQAVEAIISTARVLRF